jgi:hypothetical protein
MISADDILDGIALIREMSSYGIEDLTVQLNFSLVSTSVLQMMGLWLRAGEPMITTIYHHCTSRILAVGTHEDGSSKNAKRNTQLND